MVKRPMGVQIVKIVEESGRKGAANHGSVVQLTAIPFDNS
jgi:hypothetical protein